MDLLLYNVSASARGTLDDETGAITYDGAGANLLSLLAILVLRHGGEVAAVRTEEITAGIWNGTALARLRYPLA